MAGVGIRELKNRLSHYLKRVRQGERLVVTERGKPIAVLSPPSVTESDRHIAALIRTGAVRWAGGKPRGSPRPAKVKGPTVAEAVIEDRR